MAPAVGPDPYLDALSDVDCLGSSPVSPLPDAASWLHAPGPAEHPHRTSIQHHNRTCAAANQEDPATSYTRLSYKTLVGISELLGHGLDDRASVSSQQDPQLAALLQQSSSVQLRSPSQQPLFTVAPLDVLVTRDKATGRNTFHIIEINGTGIAGLSNMPDGVVGRIMQSLSELPAHMGHVQAPLVLVASSGQESQPPVSRTIHEKVMYIEALKRGFEAAGRPVTITNMNRLDKDPKPLSAEGPVLVLGYMKQFRQHMAVGPTGQLLLLGRQVTAAINDRFILNIMYQFGMGAIDLKQFTAFNGIFTAGADKGIAYTLYNQFFGDGGHTCMAPRINFSRAHTRDQLVEQVLGFIARQQPCVIKPQGTGCGHGIEFFFGSESRQEVEQQVAAAIESVASNYNLECGGLPFTVCEYLDTASLDTGHKFELRIVVFREGAALRAYPSIAKVAREAFDPEHPDKSSLINNITTSAKETCQAGSEFMVPLCCPRTLELLGITQQELAALCSACTHFIGHVVNQLQDAPHVFGLPDGRAAPAGVA